MGLIFSHAAFLVKAKQNGTSFDDILTIGRQTLYVTVNQCQELANRCGHTINASIIGREQYAEGFFHAMLDAKNVQSLDYSAYEECNIVHDMNQTVAPSLHEKFDAIIDGGTLEHVFNFPVAISNCMKMVRKNGSIFIFTTANNFLGHGFYQFSPELFFRIFSPENGFEIRNMVLEQHRFPGVELSSKTKMFTVADPAALGERVGLVSNSPIMLLVHAVRTEVKEPFGKFPIQSDYASRYEGGNPSKAGPARILANKILQYLPRACRTYVIGKYQLMRYSFFNRRSYRRWHLF